MRSSPHSLLSRHTLTVPLLAIVGGSVDAIVRLGLGVLVAAQTGNTILLAASIAQRRFADALQSAVSLAGYVSGTALGAAIESHWRHDRPRAVRVIIRIELIFLLALVVLWWLTGHAPADGQRSALIALAAIAMGLQSAAVLTMRVRPSTTYVTGTLTAFTKELVEREAGQPAKDEGHPEPAHESRHAMQHASRSRRPGLFMMDQPWVYGAAWFIYAIGALVGAMLFQWVDYAALLLPLAAIVVVLALESGERSAH